MRSTARHTDTYSTRYTSPSTRVCVHSDRSGESSGVRLAGGGRAAAEAAAALHACQVAAALSPRGWLAAVVRGLAAPASPRSPLPAQEQSAARSGVGFRAVGERPRDGGEPPSRSAWALPFPGLRAEARLLEGGLVILLPIAVWTRADGVPSAAVGPCGARPHPAWRGRLSL